MSQKEFTFEDAFNIQLKNLSEWASVLKTEAYLKVLQAVIERNNKGYKSPYDVCRGNDITNIISNLLN